MQVLRAVVTSGSVTAAATNLGYTPSAVSQQVAALERETGVTLLERVGRGIRPTAAGRLLTEHAEIIGRHVVEAELALADLRDGRTGTLSIRYFVTAGVSLVPPALAALRAEHPRVQIDLQILEGRDPQAEVVAGEADLAITVLAPDAPLRAGLRLVHLLDDPFRVVLPKDHRLAGRRVIDLAELAEEPWVGNEWPPGTCHQVALDACAAAGFSPGFVVESENYWCAQSFVGAGLGVSLIPVLGLDRRPGTVIRRIRRPEPVRVIFAVFRESSSSSPALRCLLEALQKAAKSVDTGRR